MRRSSSIQRASSLLATGSSCVATVAAIRNLAGRRFSATSRDHDFAPRVKAAEAHRTELIGKMDFRVVGDGAGG